MGKLFWRSFLSTMKKLGHPIFVFVALQVVWLAFVVLWVFWFMNQKETLAHISNLMGPSSATGMTGIMTLVIGSILLGMILVGTVVLFIFTQIQGSLLRQQKSFVSSVTHELRSPLASIQLSFETLQRPQLPDKVKHKLFDMVERDIGRLTQLVDRILLSARLDRGILDYSAQMETFNLSDLFHKSLDMTLHMDYRLQDRVAICCHTDITIRSIKLALSMIIGNLLENAIKYSPKSTPITIGAQLKQDELLMFVKDQGFGLNKTDIQKVFRMFHRTSRATKNAVPGTGLGLYIVKSMVRGLGGKIWVESLGIGKGSTFFLSFPADIVVNKHQLLKML